MTASSARSTNPVFPRNAERNLGGIIGSLLRAESKIYVLQSDFERALEIASAITNQRATIPTQTCHTCSADCPVFLTACPKCKAALYVEPSDRGANNVVQPLVAPSLLKYCPLCDAEYLPGYTRCSVCGVELVAEELRGRPLDDRQRNEKIVMIWRGGDSLAVSEVINRLREAGIRHHVHPTNDHLVFELGMPRPKYAVHVFASDADNAAELIADVRESLPFGLSFEPIPEEDQPRLQERSLQDWNPAAATVEVWSGEDASLAELFEACLRENRVGARKAGREPGTLRLFVAVQDEAAAREIIREIREATPPG